VNVTAAETLVAKDVLVYPVQPPHPTGTPASFVRHRARAYARSAKTPASVSVLRKTRRFRGFAVCSLRLNPVRYAPAQRELYLATEIAVRIVYRRGAGRRGAPRRARAAARRIVSDLVVNSGDVDRFAPAAAERADDAAVPTGDGSAVYLLITSEALASAFQPYVDRRTAQGAQGALVTVESIEANYTGLDVQDKIRNCIRDYYENHDTVYVALGGDDTVVPDRDCYVKVHGSSGWYTESHMPTDLYYGGLDGTWDADGDGVYGEAGEDDDVDLLPEVWVGRIPVRTAAQATDYFNKLVAYETAQPDGFSGRILLAGEKLWTMYSGDSRPSDFRDHDPVSDACIWDSRLFRDSIQPHWQPTALHHFYDTRTQWDASSHGDYVLNAANFSARLNEGYHHVFMATHGGSTSWSLESGSFSSSSALALTNATRPSIVYTIACNTGGFDRSEPCLSEAFLRNPDGGAIVYLGCSRYGWGSPGSYGGGTSFDYGRKFYEELFGNGRATIGEAFAYHKMAFASSSGSNSSRRWVMFGLNLQGDPAIGLLGEEPGRSIQIDLPNGGETYASTQEVPIRWCAGGADWQAGDTVRLDYSTDSGASWVPIDGAHALDYDAALFEWTPLDVAPSEHCRVRATYTADPGVTDASDRDFTIVSAFDLQIAKTNGVDILLPGETTTYTLTATNVGDLDATGVVITDTLPDYTDFVSASDGGALDGDTVTWNIGDLASGAGVDVTITVQVQDPAPAGAEGISNQCEVQDDGTHGPDANPSDNTATDWDELDADPDLQIAKENGVDTLVPGETTTYTLTITNVGNQDSWSVPVTDFLPDRTDFVSASDGGSLYENEVQWYLDGLAVGDSAQVTVTVRVHDTVPAGVDEITNTAEVGYGQGGYDHPSAGPPAEDTDTLDAAPDLQVAKSNGVDVLEEGQTTTYSILVTNVGNQDATGVAVTDALPDNTDFVSATGDWALDGSELTWDAFDLAAGESADLSVTVQVHDPLPQGVTEISNSAQVHDDGLNGPDPNPQDNAAADTDAVVIEWTLNVQSTPVAGAHIDGAYPGDTDYSVEIADGTEVTLIAPASFSDGSDEYAFVKWVVNDADQLEGEVAASFDITEDTTAVAEYELAQRKGDFDDDGDVDFWDFMMFTERYGMTDADPDWEPYGPIADFDDNGNCDFWDFLAFASVYGT